MLEAPIGTVDAADAWRQRHSHGAPRAQGPLYVILAAFNGWLPLRRAGRSQLARPEAAA